MSKSLNVILYLSLQDSVCAASRSQTSSSNSLTGKYSDKQKATMTVIGNELAMNFDGTLKPLTYRQKLFYTSTYSRLVCKLTKTREKAKEIIEDIEKIECFDDDIKDIVLMRK